MPLRDGDTILDGKYRIIRLLGEGGMARVWLADELTFGGRQVAIKEPHTGLLPAEEEDVQRRYAREVKVCAVLEKAHTPNIVRALTTERFDGGVLLVLEYMAGGDVAGLIKQHPDGLPIEQGLAITLSVLRALQGAHKHDLEIVHRDVKPSNILLDEKGGAYLGDFGLAQVPGWSEGRSVFRGGEHPGSVAYMAPEQETSRGYLTPGADLYAVGCVLFEMLTGKRYKRLQPGAKAGSLRADVPAWLDAVLAKALAQDPWARYQSAGDMAAAIEQGQAGAAAEQTARSREQAEAEARRKAAEQAARSREQAEAEARRKAAEEDALHRVEEEERRRRQGEQMRCSLPFAGIAVALIFVLVIGMRSCGTIASAGMARVSAGWFLMGSLESDADARNWEKPQRTVYLNGFWIDKTEVTNADFARFVQATGYRTTAEQPYHPGGVVLTADALMAVEGADWRHPSGPSSSIAGRMNHPVVQVSWDDAVEYCASVGKRLPTEAEWEKAARGTDGRTYPWGSMWDPSKANTSETGRGGTTEVGSYPSGASPYGALDMAGNVEEWVDDWFDSTYYQTAANRNPQGPSSGAHHAVRGGKWFSRAEEVRSPSRFSVIFADTSAVYGYIGFRCARSSLP